MICLIFKASTRSRDEHQVEDSTCAGCGLTSGGAGGDDVAAKEEGGGDGKSEGSLGGLLYDAVTTDCGSLQQTAPPRRVTRIEARWSDQTPQGE
jgi:hypothetical protein